MLANSWRAQRVLRATELFWLNNHLPGCAALISVLVAGLLNQYISAHAAQNWDVCLLASLTRCVVSHHIPGRAQRKPQVTGLRGSSLRLTTKPGVPRQALPDVVWPAAAKRQPRVRSARRGCCRSTGAAFD